MDDMIRTLKEYHESSEGSRDASAATPPASLRNEENDARVWAKTESLLRQLNKPGGDTSSSSSTKPPRLRQLIVPRRTLTKPGTEYEMSAVSRTLHELLRETMQEDTASQLFSVLSELNGKLQQLQQKRADERSARGVAENASDDTLSFEDFCDLRENVSQQLRKWLTTKVFVMLRNVHNGENSLLDGSHTNASMEGGRIDIHILYDLFYSIGCTVKTRLTLQGYQDPNLPMGYLQEQDIERWIIDLYPSITSKSNFARDSPDFLAVYTAAASRSFFFFLDPHRLGRVHIEELVKSQITDALLEVTLANEEEAVSDSELVALSDNYFSPLCVRRIFEHYTELDTEDCGLVSKDALRLFQGLTLDPPRALTRAFFDRLFEEIPTHSQPGNKGNSYESNTNNSSTPKMKYLDFKGFIDLTLAFEYITSTAGLRYLWKIIDIQKQGYIDKFTISYFYRDITVGLKNEGLEAPEVADVIDEIFDMVRPKNGDSSRITFADLCACKSGHTVCGILVDVNAFWLYENRENLIHYDES